MAGKMLGSTNDQISALLSQEAIILPLFLASLGAFWSRQCLLIACCMPHLGLLWGAAEGRQQRRLFLLDRRGQQSRSDSHPSQGRLCLGLQLGNMVTKAGEGRVLMEAMASLGRQAPERPSYLHTRGHLQLSKETVLSYKLYWEQKSLLSIGLVLSSHSVERVSIGPCTGTLGTLGP